MKKYILDDLVIEEACTSRELISHEERRKQHLHLLIAQILGFIAGIVVVILAYMYDSEPSILETAFLLLTFPAAFLMIFRLITRLFQVLRIKLGRQIYNEYTGESYIIPSRFWAAILAYSIGTGITTFACSILGFAELALEANIFCKIVGLAAVIIFCILLLVLSTYLFYRDIDYVRTRGVGSTTVKVKERFKVAITVLSLLAIACGLVFAVAMLATR